MEPNSKLLMMEKMSRFLKFDLRSTVNQSSHAEQTCAKVQDFFFCPNLIVYIIITIIDRAAFKRSKENIN